MHWKQVVRWLKPGRTAEQSGAGSQRMDEAVAARVRRLQAVDPGTDEQWQRLRTSLTKDEATAIAPRTARGMDPFRPAMAFGVVLAVIVAVGMWLLEPSVKTYETIQGQQATIMLPDSTEVVLNHTSQLTISHSLFERERRVALKGEAFFHVQHNGKPFVVSTDVASVQVLGTEFNVQDRDGQMEVGVVRGSVRITCMSSGRDSSIVLLEDQIVACTTNGFKDKPSQLPFPNFPGWIHGKIMLYRTDLVSACRQLESQFGITITIQNQKFKNVTITGTLDGNNVDTALATLASLTGTNVRHENSNYMLY